MCDIAYTWSGLQLGFNSCPKVRKGALSAAVEQGQWLVLRGLDLATAPVQQLLEQAMHDLSRGGLRLGLCAENRCVFISSALRQSVR